MYFFLLIFLLAENRFTYEDPSSPSSSSPPPQSPSSTRFDSQSRISRLTCDGRQSVQSNFAGKDDQDCWSEDDYASSSTAAVTKNVNRRQQQQQQQQQQQHHCIRPFHRASVVSAPPSTARSGSFSIVGVRV